MTPMTRISPSRRVRRDEQGMAMITAIMVIMITAALAVIVLNTGQHSQQTARRGRNWDDALQTADGGVQRAIAYLQSTNGGVPPTLTGTTDSGAYTTTVTYLGRNRYQIDSSGTTGGNIKGLTATRTIRVVMGPPKSFRYALFSLTDVDTKNNNYVTGSVWANGSVTVYGGDTITGNAWAATGWLSMGTNSTIGQDAATGGYDPSSGQAMTLANGAHIGGKATASSSTPSCADDPSGTKYIINDGGSISGTTMTWGTKTGSGTTGTLFTHVCTSAPATKPIPTFTYNPLNYNPAPMEFASPAAFSSWLSTHHANLSGTYLIHGGDANNPVDINGVSIGGDTTIIAESAPIDAFGGVGVSAQNTSDKVLVLVSYYQPAVGAVCTNNGGNPADCAIGIKNNFQPNDNTATLIYAPNGPCAFKNNADFDGAVYCKNIVLKNNMNLTYDARVDQIVGFGPVTLEQESWIETTGG
jgi:hypothetical protein